MRVLILSADYTSFLTSLYRSNPEMERLSYDEQKRIRIASLFGVTNSYSEGFTLLGHESRQVFINNIWMQSRWAQEHGLSVPPPPPPNEAGRDIGEFAMFLKRRLRRYKDVLAPIAKKMGLIQSLSPITQQVLLAQIEAFNPDVVLNQEIEIVDGSLLRAVKRPGRIIIGQHGNQPPGNFEAAPYDFGISHIPAVVQFFRDKGLPAEQVHLAFDPQILEQLGAAPQKDIEVSFVGGLASNHGKRIELLEGIAREMPIALYLSSFKGIPASSPLHKYVRPEVWGRDMFNVLRRSKITLNSHIDAAKGMAGNMRLYEATGVGTFLLTDNLPNLPELFQPGVHVGAYDSAQDCIAKIRHYLAHSAEREAIASAGQQQTLVHHSYRQRVETLLQLVAKYSS